MKNVSTLFLSLAAIITASVPALAGPRDHFEGPAVCGMTFEARGGGIQILVGDFRLVGRGMISCKDLEGNETNMPVDVQFGGRSPVALKIAIGHLHIAGAATGVGYSRSPSDLLGDYLLAGGEAAVGLGAGANVSLHARGHAATLDLNFQVEHGLGLNAGFQSLTIRPARR